jgi:hypothetical protein
MSSSLSRARGVPAAVARAVAGVVVCAASATDASAQQRSAPAMMPSSAWPTLSAEWLGTGTGPIRRGALPSLAATIGWQPRGGILSRWRVDAGYLRDARTRTTGEGATLGLAHVVRVGRLTLLPGIAGLVGRAHAYSGGQSYDWQGIAAPFLGQTGTQTQGVHVRESTTGIGAMLGAAIRLSPGLVATASVRQWRFSNDILGDRQSPTLAGFGLSITPGATASLTGNGR